LVTFVLAKEAENLEIRADKYRDMLRTQVLESGLFPRDTRRGAGNE